ncbi:MAG: hypothetical protein ABIA04_07195 [Pseudomonadota bacterium]
MKKVISLLILVLLVGCTKEISFEQRREKVISELNFAIENAKEEGKYKCCIEPACTMCYLGHWIWKDGSCYCDDMIAKGEMDKVCPECQKGIEEGFCKSTIEKPCDPESGEIFRSIGP